MRKIDIHTHLLPGLDDGAKNQTESLKLIRMAVDQEIRTFIATPHASPQFPPVSPERIREECLRLEEAAREAVDPEIRIYAGQEIFWMSESLERLERGELLTLAGSMYMLVEFAPHVPYRELLRSLQEIRLDGYIPVLAHAERYQTLRKDDGRLPELIEKGVLIQMNYQSVTGSWMDATPRWCKKMLKEGQIHFLASDLHNTTRRPPRTEDAERWLRRKLPEEYVEELLFGNAERVLKNESI